VVQTDQANAADDTLTVKDDEEYVAKRIKKRILDSRDRVDQREDLLFAGRVLDPEVDIPEHRAVRAFGKTVQQFVRNIRVLLTSFPEGDGQRYFEQTDLGHVTLYPPNTDSYQFGDAARSSRPPEEVKKDLGLPREASLPEPSTVTFDGLKSILEHDPVLRQRWSVQVSTGHGRESAEYVTVHAQQVVPKHIYDAAVEAADEFLNNIGMGVDIDPGEWRSGEPGL